MRETVLAAFKGRWEHINAMTTSFAECVPADKWNDSPGQGFAPFGKQLRHVVCVRGVYNDGLRSKKIDFSRKHHHYSGSLDRDELLAALAAKHDDLLVLLDELPPDIEARDIDFFGMQQSPIDYLYVYIQHEAIHHGQWSLYAAHGGYATPQLWRMQWGLGSGSV